MQPGQVTMPTHPGAVPTPAPIPMPPAGNASPMATSAMHAPHTPLPGTAGTSRSNSSAGYVEAVASPHNKGAATFSVGVNVTHGRRGTQQTGIPPQPRLSSSGNITVGSVEAAAKAAAAAAAAAVARVSLHGSSASSRPGSAPSSAAPSRSVSCTGAEPNFPNMPPTPKGSMSVDKKHQNSRLQQTDSAASIGSVSQAINAAVSPSSSAPTISQPGMSAGDVSKPAPPPGQSLSSLQSTRSSGGAVSGLSRQPLGGGGTSSAPVHTAVVAPPPPPAPTQNFATAPTSHPAWHNATMQHPNLNKEDGSNIYVGNLASTVDENVLHTTFAPFGYIMSVQVSTVTPSILCEVFIPTGSHCL